jgi:hypothetical protein
VQPPPHRLGLIVGPLDEGRAVAIADARLLRRVAAQVVHRSVLRAAHAAAQPVDQDLHRDLQRKDVVDPAAPPREHLVERGGLRDRAGISVEEEAALRLGTRQRLVDDPVDHFVRHELPRVHQRLGLPAEGRPFGDGAAEDVSRGELRDREPLRQTLRLRALPRSGWSP